MAALSDIAIRVPSSGRAALLADKLTALSAFHEKS